MPTARPSITPSTGVTDDMSTTPEKAREPATPTPTPRIEESSGRAAGSNEPNMTMRTAGDEKSDDLAGADKSVARVAIGRGVAIDTPSIPAASSRSATAAFIAAGTRLPHPRR